MKQLYRLLLPLACMLLLCACAAVPADTTPTPPPDTNAPTGEAIPTEQAIPSYEFPTVLPDMLPEPEYLFRADPLLEQEKGKDYYFLCSEMDISLNIQENETDNLSFLLLSKTAIDPKSIQITLPLEQIGYEVDIRASNGGDEIEEFLYKSYLGWDWLADAYLNTALASAEDFAYREYESAISQQYQKAKEGALPGSLNDYFAYGVSITFSYPEELDHEEVLTQMDVRWPGVSFLHNCGKLRFYSGEVTQAKTVVNAYTDYFAPKASGFPITKIGMAATTIPFRFTAMKDMTLERVSFPSDRQQLLSIQVSLTNEANTVNVIWDGKTPLPVTAGTKVNMRVFYEDIRLTYLSKIGRSTAFLHYLCDGGEGIAKQSITDANGFPSHVLAAHFFDDVDIIPYFKYYFVYVLAPNSWGA